MNIVNQGPTKDDFWNEIAGSLCCSNMGRGINLRGKILHPLYDPLLVEKPMPRYRSTLTVPLRVCLFYGTMAWLCGVAGGYLVCTVMHP